MKERSSKQCTYSAHVAATISRQFTPNMKKENTAAFSSKSADLLKDCISKSQKSITITRDRSQRKKTKKFQY